jgi:ribokinase
MDARVVVVGSVNVDLVVEAPRLPTAGETVLGERLERHQGGKGANAAVAAARLGAATTLVAAVGDDDFGRAARDALDAEGVDGERIAVLAGVPTGAALIVVDPAGENQIAVGAGANARLAADHVRAAVSGALAAGPGAGRASVLVSLEIPDAAVEAAIAAGRAAGATVIIDPAPARASVLELDLAGVLLVPNAGEARTLAGVAELDAAVRRLAERTGAPVVATDGAHGALAVSAPDAPPERVVVPGGVRSVDTTGAGDAFAGALAARLAAGDRLADAVRFAVAAGAHAVGAVGARTGMPTEAEVRAVLERAA